MTSSRSGIPADTTPEAAAEQERLFAEMEPHERVRIALELSETARRMTMAGIRSRHPDISEAELRKRLIRLLYGEVPDP